MAQHMKHIVSAHVLITTRMYVWMLARGTCSCCCDQTFTQRLQCPSTCAHNSYLDMSVMFCADALGPWTEQQTASNQDAQLCPSLRLLEWPWHGP